MTVSEDVAGVANKLTSTLPPGFVTMVALNIVFILGLLWFMHDIQITRIEAITKIFQTCATSISKSVQ